MHHLKVQIYWRLPHFLKNVAASVNAGKLDRERHGVEFEQILQEIAEHDKWSREQFYEYQCHELRSLLRLAAANVPYYRKLFSERGIRPEIIERIEDLPSMPILEKEVARANPIALVDKTLNMNKLVKVHTSGTTGTPLDLYRDVWMNSAEFAYGESRWHSVAQVHRRVNRSVSLGGHLVASPDRTRPPFWVFNRRWNQLYMSSYHLAPQYLGSYVDQLRKFKADYIEGYPSSVYAIAQYIIDNKLEPFSLKACFTTAETLFDYQRRSIRKAFGCRTYNQYGCGEGVVFAAECEHGSMHLSPEVGIVEVVDDQDRPVPTGQTGQLICTSLINKVQPFIRYRVGDVGSLSDEQCPCGSSLPILGSIEGRIDDVLITADGRRIGRLDPVFKGARGIAEAQIVQNDYDKFVVRIVPGRDYSDADGQSIVTNLGHRVGDADIRIEIVDKIERTKSGKFRAVICNLPKQTAKNAERT